MPKKWSKKYKRSIDCNNPKGFSQKAHCAGRKKQESKMSLKLEEVVGKSLTEEQFDEAAGEKDACYHKVKARYDVWPSAYASGALVKCRKVGAKNWGNKSKKEGSIKEFGLSPMDKALKQKLKDPKSGKEVTVGSIKNQGTKRYSSSLVKKANAIFKKAMEKEMATKKKIRKMRGEGVVNEKRGTCWVGYQQVGMKKKGGKMVPNCVKEVYDIYWEENGKGHGYTFEHIIDDNLFEAEYQGRKVKLGKPMQGDTKKFKVYVKNPKGNVVKVNFGQGGDAKGGTMRIRKDNPKARKSFRARHNCDNPGPRHKARYWSCKKW